MLPILQLGPLALPVAPLTLLVGLWIGLSQAEKEAARLGLNPAAIYNLALTALLAGLIGARLAYAQRHLAAFAADPLGLILPNPAAFSAPEGAVVGLLAAWVYGTRQGLALRPTLEAFAPTLAGLGVAVALANLASGDGFGAPARLPWSVYLWDDYRHPAQLYELAAAIGILAGWGWARPRLAPGQGFLLVVALSAAARLFLEAYRGDSVLIGDGWRAAQVVALAALGVSLVWFRRWGETSQATN